MPMTAIDPADINSNRITEEQRAALRAADPDAFEDDPPDAPTDEIGGDASVFSNTDAAEPEPNPVNPPARAAVPMIPKPRLDEVLNRVQDLERQLRERDAQATATPNLQVRDFAAERGQIKTHWEAETSALKKQWDDGDLDADEYHDQRDALSIKYADLSHTLTVEEARHVAKAERVAADQQATQQAAQTQWNTKIAQWAIANEAFMANPIRKKAVADLLMALDTEGDSSLDDDGLIALMQEQAFDAFGWTAPAPTPAPVDPRVAATQARQAAAARAAAAASAAPPQVAGGAGAGNRDLMIDLEQLKPGDFKKIPESAQRALLGEDIV